MRHFYSLYRLLFGASLLLSFTFALKAKEAPLSSVHDSVLPFFHPATISSPLLVEEDWEGKQQSVHQLLMGISLSYGASRDRVLSNAFYDAVGIGFTLEYQHMGSFFQQRFHMNAEGTVLINSNRLQQIQWYGAYFPSFGFTTEVSYLLAPYLWQNDWIKLYLGPRISTFTTFNHFSWQISTSNTLTSQLISFFFHLHAQIGLIFLWPQSLLRELEFMVDFNLLGYALRPDWSNFSFIHAFSYLGQTNLIKGKVALYFSPNKQARGLVVWSHTLHYLDTALPQQRDLRGLQRLAYQMTLGNRWYW